MIGIARFSLGTLDLFFRTGLGNPHRARCTIELKKGAFNTFFLGRRRAVQHQHQRLTRIDLNGNLLLLPHAVEECLCRQTAYIAVGAAVIAKVLEYFRIHQP